MKIKSLILAAALASSGILSSHATSITLSSSPLGRAVADSALAALADGDLVLVGTFANPLGLGLAPALDLAAGAGWTQFGPALAIGSIFGNPGKLLGTATDTTAAADFFDDKPIYLWIFNAPTAEQATEWGIFTASGASPGWAFPVNNGGIGDLLTLSADIPQLTAVNGLGAVTDDHLQLAQAVPEPGVWMLATAAGVFLLLARRRAFSQPAS